MTKEYTEDDVLDCNDLNKMPISTTIVGLDTYYSAIKTGDDKWTFDDRIETWRNRSSRFIKSAFEYTNFEVNMPDIIR